MERGDTVQVKHKENGERLVISVDSHEFHMMDRSVGEIVQAVFQAYQAATRDTILRLGFREEVVDAYFDERFSEVEFDCMLPLDIRLKDIEEWVVLCNDDSKEKS